MEIKDLKPEHKGRKVVYRNRHTMEEGVITSWNDTFVHVRYGSDNHSKATKSEDLEFV